MRNKISKVDQKQGLLLLIALLFMMIYGTILTLAPSVRYHQNSPEFYHWVGIAAWIITFLTLHLQSSRKLPNRDPYILPIVSMLVGIGLLTIWRLYPNFGLRQSIWLVISGFLILVCMQFPRFLILLRRYKYIWLVSGLILTALTLFLGTNPGGTGPKLWLNIFGMYFQPSEPLKLLLIIYLAGYFSDRIWMVDNNIQNLLPTLIVNGIAILLLIFQRDLGTATIFVFLYLAMLFAAPKNKWVIWITPILFLISGLAGYFFIDIVTTRINTWLMPFRDPSGASYQIIQSWIAIAEGNLIGTGPGLGSPGIVPVSLSDFVFSAISEELGLLGAVGLILLVILLIYRGLRITSYTKKAYPRYLALGLITYLGSQSILIIGGNLGLLPLTGVTFPFVSYGGTSLVVSFVAIYLLLTLSNSPDENPQILRPTQQRHTWIGISLIAILIFEIIATSLISFWLRSQLVSRPENPRWSIDDRFTELGDIVDRDNNIIASNAGTTGSFERINAYPPFYPIIGYTNPVYGRTGIESSMYPYLRGNQGYPFSTLFWKNLLYNQPPEGLDVRLTIDLDLQTLADEHLEGINGAIIMMNANSGEILIMSSHPYFDAKNLEDSWEDLIRDQNAPLVNRVTQGEYPPGTTLLPFIIAAQYEKNTASAWQSDIFENPTLSASCALPLEETLTWSALVSHGCVKSQEDLAKNLGFDALLEIYQSLGLFSEPALRLNVAESDPLSVSPGDQFFLGEEPFKISPLQMAIAASAITNDGILPGPRIVNAYKSPDGEWIILPKLSSNQQILSPQTTGQVQNLIKAENLPYWIATSRCEDEEGKIMSWFVAGTSEDWPGQPLVLVIIIEKDDPQLANRIGESLLQQSIQVLTENSN